MESLLFQLRSLSTLPAVTFSPADVAPIPVSLPPPTNSFPTTPAPPLVVNLIRAPPSLICQSHSVSAACQTQMVNGNNNLMGDAAYQTPPAISTYPIQRSSSLLPLIPL